MTFQSTSGLLPGFADSVSDSQRVFRSLLTAMSRPGTIVGIGAMARAPFPLDPATAAAVLALVDADTPLWLDPAAANQAVSGYFRFHCGCPLVADPSKAAFAVIADPAAMPPLSAFEAGSDEYPDRSATLIIQVPALEGGTRLALSGPGICGSTTLSPAGLPREFPDWLEENHALFPRGIDIVFACAGRVAALARSTRTEG